MRQIRHVIHLSAFRLAIISHMYTSVLMVKLTLFSPLRIICEGVCIRVGTLSVCQAPSFKSLPCTDGAHNTETYVCLQKKVTADKQILMGKGWRGKGVERRELMLRY